MKAIGGPTIDEGSSSSKSDSEYNGWKKSGGFGMPATSVNKYFDKEDLDKASTDVYHLIAGTLIRLAQFKALKVLN